MYALVEGKYISSDLAKKYNNYFSYKFLIDYRVWNINYNNQKFIVSGNTITIPEGLYTTTTELLDEIQTQINAVIPGTIISLVDGKFTNITFLAAQTINMNQSLMSLLGFETTAGAAAVFQGTQRINIYDSIYPLFIKFEPTVFGELIETDFGTFDIILTTNEPNIGDILRVKENNIRKLNSNINRGLFSIRYFNYYGHETFNESSKNILILYEKKALN